MTGRHLVYEWLPEKEQQQENKKINDKYILIAEAFVTCQEQI